MTPAKAKTAAARTRDSVPFPVSVVVDSREKFPFEFVGLRTTAAAGSLPLIVSTVRRGLNAGDYSLDGFEDRIAIERKGLSDLYSTLAHGRRRFVHELARLDAIAAHPSGGFACVVIEADWRTIIESPPATRRGQFSRLNPKSIFGSVIAWQQRFPRVHWWAVDGREFAMRATFRILERFWLDRRGTDRVAKERTA